MVYISEYMKQRKVTIKAPYLLKINNKEMGDYKIKSKN